MDSRNMANKVILIAAMDENRGLGKNGKMAWYVPEDLAFFKEMTLGKVVVMGRVTYEGIGHPLVNRKVIVVTSDRTYHPKDVEVCNRIEEVMQYPCGELWIAGGSQIYQETIDCVDEMYLTRVVGKYPVDVYFPCFDESLFDKTIVKEGSNYYIEHYVRK